MLTTSMTIRDGCSINYNKSVKVYRNLNNKKLSIMQDSKVVAYAEYIYLTNVSFHIQKAGQAKCRLEKRKNVHAYAKGYISNIESVSGVYVTYNPYENDTFIDEHCNPIHKANKLVIANDGYMIANVEVFEWMLNINKQWMLTYLTIT